MITRVCWKGWIGLPFWALLCCLSGCAGPPPTERPAATAGSSVDRLAPDWLAESGTPVMLDQQRSWLRVQAYRAGRLARLGHNHLIEAREPSGELRRLDSGGGLARLRFRPAQMRVDDPDVRAQAGDDFTQTPDAGAVEATRRNLLGPRVLHAAVWPEIVLLARVDALTAGQAVAELWIGLRGVSRRYQVPIRIEHAADEIRVVGSLALNQSDFGITPFSVMAGALQVRDRVLVDFQVVGRNSQDAL